MRHLSTPERITAAIVSTLLASVVVGVALSLARRRGGGAAATAAVLLAVVVFVAALSWLTEALWNAVLVPLLPRTVAPMTSLWQPVGLSLLLTLLLRTVA
jgi:multisubunit Na+/H+ antiporter MnhB subunit